MFTRYMNNSSDDRASSPPSEPEDRGAARRSYAEVSKSDQSDYEAINHPGRGMPKTSGQVPQQIEPTVTDYIPKYIHEIDSEVLIRAVNPARFVKPHKDSRYFVIRSYSEEDVHRSVKYSIWSSSWPNNITLDNAYNGISRESEDMDSLENVPAFLCDKPMVYLFFSVEGSGSFCGVARMASRFHKYKDAGVWCNEKWRGLFYVRWLYVKDVPNPHLRHIRLPPNKKGEIKPVTISRDCTEVLGEEKGVKNGVRVLDVIHHYKYTTTLFDDYEHYDRLEMDTYLYGRRDN